MELSRQRSEDREVNQGSVHGEGTGARMTGADARRADGAAEAAMADAVDEGEAAQDDESDHVGFGNSGFEEPTVPMNDEWLIVLRPDMGDN